MHTRESNRTQSGRDQPSAPPTTTARRRPNRHRNEPRPPTPSDSSSQLYYTIPSFRDYSASAPNGNMRWPTHARDARKDGRNPRAACVQPGTPNQPAAARPFRPPPLLLLLHCTALHCTSAHVAVGWVGNRLKQGTGSSSCSWFCVLPRQETARLICIGPSLLPEQNRVGRFPWSVGRRRR